MLGFSQYLRLTVGVFGTVRDIFEVSFAERTYYYFVIRDAAPFRDRIPFKIAAKEIDSEIKL